MINKHNKCIELIQQRESLETELIQFNALLNTYNRNPIEHYTVFYTDGELESKIEDIETKLRAVKSEYLEVMTQLAMNYKY